MATISSIVNEEAPPEADDNGLLRSSTSTFQPYQTRGHTSMVAPDGVDMSEEQLTNEGLPLASVLSTEMPPNCPPNDEEQTVFTLLNITNQFNQKKKIISQRASKYDLNSTNMFRNLMLFHRERFKQGDRSRVPLSADKDVYDYLSYYDSKKLTKICRYADAISEWPKRPSYGQRDILNNRSDNEINNDRNNIESNKSDCEMVQIDDSHGDSQQQQQQLQFDGEHEYSDSNENNDFFPSQSNEPDNNYQGLDYGGEQFDFDNQEQFYDQNVEGFYDDEYNLDSPLGWLNSGAETDLNDGIEGFDNEEKNAFATFEENLNNLQDDDELSVLNSELDIENSNSFGVSSNSLINFANQSHDPDDLATSSMQLINNESNVMWQQQELPSGSLQQSLFDVEPNNSDYEMLQINELQQQQQFDDEHDYSDSNENDFFASQINHSIDNNYQGLDYGDQFVFDNQQNMEGIMMVNDNDGSEGNEEQSAVDGEQENSANNEANNSLASQVNQLNNNYERFDNGGDQFALDDQQQFNNQIIEVVCPDFRNHYEGYNSDSSIECLDSEEKIDSNNIKVSDTNEEQSANQTNDTNVVQVVTNLIEPVNDEPIVMGQQQELPSKSLVQAKDDNLNNCDSDGDETEIDESWKEYENDSSAQESFFVIDNAQNGTNNNGSCEPSDDTSLNGSISIPSTSVHPLRRSSPRTTTKSRTNQEKNNSESGSDSAIALPKSKESTAKKRKQTLQSNKAKKKARKDKEEDDRELSDEFEDEQGGMNRREVRKNKCRKIVKTIGFYCPECSEFVVNKHKLNEHLLSVHKISPFICHIFGCKQRFDKSKLLKKHNQLHEDKTKLTCTAANCKYTTSKRNCLMAHFSLYHMKGRFGCRLCSKEYPFKRQVYNHFCRDHKTETYPCTFGECSFHSARECELKEHLICHTNLKPFECTWKDCGFVANRHRNVTTHVRAVHFKLPVTLKAMKKRKIKCDRDPKQYVRTKSFDLDAELKKELKKAQRNYNSKDKGGNGHSIASTSGVDQRSL